ncbi:MAG: SIMPL domain-containing protein [Pseudomonadota bacterium]
MVFRLLHARSRHRRPLDLAALALALSVLAPLAADLRSAHAHDGLANAPQITVTGRATISAEPDIAAITAGVISDAPTARQAVSANNELMEQVIATLRAAGVAKRDIQTSDFSVNPRYDRRRDGSPPRVVAFQVSNRVRVTVRRIATLGRLLDATISSGANQVYGISFALEDEGQAADLARAAAIKDARRKANLYAQAAGVTLGRVLKITETRTGDVGGGRRFEAVQRSRAVPIAAGRKTVGVTVNVVWALD